MYNPLNLAKRVIRLSKLPPSSYLRPSQVPKKATFHLPLILPSPHLFVKNPSRRSLALDQSLAFSLGLTLTRALIYTVQSYCHSLDALSTNTIGNNLIMEANRKTPTTTTMLVIKPK